MCYRIGTISVKEWYHWLPPVYGTKNRKERIPETKIGNVTIMMHIQNSLMNIENIANVKQVSVHSPRHIH